MNLAELRIALVGPLPPPAGGMANQTRQLGDLLQRDGAKITIVQTNAAYRPRYIESIRGVRALFRLVPYVLTLWRVAGRADVFHVMANSGWSWHLFVSPAVWVARMRGVPAVVNYRGGAAEPFLARSRARVLGTLRHASVVAVPSAFLQQVFGRHGIPSEIVPNIIDTELFRPARAGSATPHLIVTRNLEPIYDIAMALRAFSLILQDTPHAKLTVAGSGPDHQALTSLAGELGISEAVTFSGRLDRGRMAELYRSASVMINPSRIDNMPNSVLEAMASGVPVVSTDVGGIPFIVRDGITGLLCRAGDHAAIAAAVQRILRDQALAARLRDAALIEVQQYTWSRVRQTWLDLYASVLSRDRIEVRPA